VSSTPVVQTHTAAPVQTHTAKVAKRAAVKKRAAPMPHLSAVTRPIHDLAAAGAAAGKRIVAPSLVVGASDGSSSVSWLLLAIGLGLVILVVGQTTLLGLAEPRLQASEPKPRPRAKERDEDELPIRRVELRR
jgi:hypothetical protein